MNAPSGFGQGHDPRHLEAAEEAWLTHGLEQSLRSPGMEPRPTPPQPRGQRVFAAVALLLGVSIVGFVLMGRRDPAEDGNHRAGQTPPVDPEALTPPDAERPQDSSLTRDPASPLTLLQVRSAAELDRWLPQVLRIKVWQPTAVHLGGGAVRYHPAADCAGYLLDKAAIARACAALRDAVRSPKQAESVVRSFQFALELGERREIHGVLRTESAAPESSGAVALECGADVLGPFALPAGLLTALQPAIADATEAARTGFAVVTQETLAGVPRTVRNLVTYGPSDRALAALGELRALETLHIYGYGAEEALDPVRKLVTDKFAESLPELPHLRSVQLTGTKTTGEVFKHLGRLPALQELVIDEAHRGDYRGAAFAGLRQSRGLRALQLRGLTSFDRATVDSIAELRRLEQLQLEVVGAPDLGSLLSDFVGRSTVEHLSLRGLHLPENWLTRPAGSTRSLRRLRIEDAEVSLEGLHAHTNLDELVLERVVLTGREGRVLEPISHTRVRTVALRAMPDLQLAHLPPSVRRLDLRSCQLTAAQLLELQRLNRLEALDLRDNGLGADDVADLCAVLGDAVVYW